MRKIFHLWKIICLLVVTTFVAHAELPECHGWFGCGDYYVLEEVGAATITIHPKQIDPFLKFDECTNSSCCGTMFCNLSVTQTVVDGGQWSDEVGGQFGIELPIGVGLIGVGLSVSANGKVSKGGFTEVSVATQSTNGCTINACQSYDLEFGPSYISIIREFPARMNCYNAPEMAFVCDSEDFTSRESLRYLEDATDVMGTCGLLSSMGCGSSNPNPCATPSSPVCPT